MRIRVHPAALVALVLAAIVFGAWLSRGVGTGVSAGPAAEAVRYYCPMHPQYTSDHPGIAPCCGMQLEPLREGSGGAAGRSAGMPYVAPATQQLMGVKLGSVEYSEGRHELRVPGRVSADENRLYPLTAKVEGTVRKIYPAATTGSFVRKGDPLVDIYSYDYLQAQQAYFVALDAVERARTNPGLSSPEQAEARLIDEKTNLSIVGFSAAQVEEITHARKVVTTATISAPVDGYIVARNVYPDLKAERGSELFRLVDLSRVWVWADLSAQEGRFVRAGQPARIYLPSGESPFEARVSDILPPFDPASRTLKARLELANPGKELRPDMFVTVELPIEQPRALTAPAEAVLDTGARKTVFVDAGDGYFEPRPVETGWRLGDRVEIRSGLKASERIVVSGNFLLDSESRMRLAAAGISAQAARDPVCGMDVDIRKASAAGRRSERSGKTYYFCNEQCKREFDHDPAQYATH